MKPVKLKIEIQKLSEEYIFLDRRIGYTERFASQFGWHDIWRYHGKDILEIFSVYPTLKDDSPRKLTPEEVNMLSEYFISMLEKGEMLTLYNIDFDYWDQLPLVNRLLEAGVLMLKLVTTRAKLIAPDGSELQAHLPYPQGVLEESPFFPTCNLWQEVLAFLY